MTIVGVTLVDRKGRKFLFILGTSGILISLACTGGLFLATESHNIDCSTAVRSLVTPDQTLSLRFDPAEVTRLLGASTPASQAVDRDKSSLMVIYSYGGFSSETSFLRSDDPHPQPITITRQESIPSSRVDAFFKNPFLDLKNARNAPLKIERASIGRIPDARHGWLVAASLYSFVAFYALGPGVCVWLALSELMPTRIRSNGMSIALVINQLVSTVLAGIFLPVVSKHGYSSMFFLFAGFTLVYFLVVTFALPETKGRTLEEIEAFFEPAAQ
jgi:MFS family permease